MVAAVRAGNMELAEVHAVYQCFPREWALELCRPSSSCCAIPGGHANDAEILQEGLPEDAG